MRQYHYWVRQEELNHGKVCFGLDGGMAVNRSLYFRVGREDWENWIYVPNLFTGGVQRSFVSGGTARHRGP